jgi:hypothetical protein
MNDDEIGADRLGDGLIGGIGLQHWFSSSAPTHSRSCPTVLQERQVCAKRPEFLPQGGFPVKTSWIHNALGQTAQFEVAPCRELLRV